ncbi:MAG: hypothetical protein OEL76_03500 [Siculibacillus sp.]|nr:hypothetical protein [Siculibacillus sp.]
MTRDGRPGRKSEPTFAEGENPYVPPIWYLATIGALALVVLATLV